PIVRTFASAAGIDVTLSDISLAARVLSAFPECHDNKDAPVDGLEQLGELTKQPHANIIKLPNISASVPQLRACIKELQAQGYKLPDLPEEAKTEEEKNILDRYSSVLGSAVNPVLRQGNSDRRAPAAVKAFVRKY